MTKSRDNSPELPMSFPPRPARDLKYEREHITAGHYATIVALRKLRHANSEAPRFVIWRAGNNSHIVNGDHMSSGALMLLAERVFGKVGNTETPTEGTADHGPKHTSEYTSDCLSAG